MSPSGIVIVLFLVPPLILGEMWGQDCFPTETQELIKRVEGGGNPEEEQFVRVRVGREDDDSFNDTITLNLADGDEGRWYKREFESRIPNSQIFSWALSPLWMYERLNNATLDFSISCPDNCNVTQVVGRCGSAVFRTFSIKLISSSSSSSSAGRIRYYKWTTSDSDDDGGNSIPAETGVVREACLHEGVKCPGERSNFCIHSSWQCDNYRNCPNGSDESPALCTSAYGGTTTSGSNIAAVGVVGCIAAISTFLLLTAWLHAIRDKRGKPDDESSQDPRPDPFDPEAERGMIRTGSLRSIHCEEDDRSSVRLTSYVALSSSTTSTRAPAPNSTLIKAVPPPDRAGKGDGKLTNNKWRRATIF